VSKPLKGILIGIVAAVLATLYGFYSDYMGYRRGQIDYARGHVEYTIISERVIHIMGDAPLPDTRLTPIPEKE